MGMSLSRALFWNFFLRNKSQEELLALLSVVIVSQSLTFIYRVDGSIPTGIGHMMHSEVNFLMRTVGLQISTIVIAPW